VAGPARKRAAVTHLEAVLEVPQRRACQVIAQPRSTQRYRGRQRGKDVALAAELRRISAAHPRAGYRMATALLRRAGMEINAKRVQRLWRQEGLKVPRRQRQRQRLGSSESGTQRLRAERINQVWSDDFIFDQTEDGRRLKWLPICEWLPICDEFSRELVALEVERRMEAKDVIRILEAAVLARGSAPEFIRSANGPEFVSLAVHRTGSRGAGSRRSTSRPAARGRMPAAKASTAGSGTSSSTVKASPRSWRRKCSARNIGSGTTTSVRTRR
jgi:putative transposase